MLAKPILKRILHFRSLAMKYHKPFALDGVELVRRKVARAVVMGGAFADAAEPEYNFAMDPKAVLAFFRLWPREVEIVFSPAEVGDAIDYPPAQVVADIDWTDRHPIKQVYQRCDCAKIGRAHV